jgi:hypothetical protein
MASPISDWLLLPPAGAGGLAGAIVMTAIYIADKLLNHRHARRMAQEQRISMEAHHRQVRQTMDHALARGKARRIEVTLPDGTSLRVDRVTELHETDGVPEPESGGRRLRPLPSAAQGEGP